MLSPKVVALDVASTTGICIGVPETRAPVFLNIRFTREGEGGSMDGVAEAAGRALLWWIEFIKLTAPEDVVIEAPVPEAALGHATNAWSTAMKFALVGALSGVCKARSIPVRWANIQRVRKHFLGHGNLAGDLAKRETMRFALAAGWAPKTYDEADAGAVWHWRCSQIAPQLVQPINPLFLGAPPVAVPRRSPRISIAPKRFGGGRAAE